MEVSAVKRADDGSGDLIVRLAEVCGDRAIVEVRLPAGVGSASRCNVLEEPLAPLDVTDAFVAVSLRPFELVTLRLTPPTLTARSVVNSDLGPRAAERQGQPARRCFTATEV